MRIFQSHGIYRFFTAAEKGGPNRYLTVNSAGEVVGAPLDDPIGIQEWMVTKRSNDVFDIVNIATERSLRVLSKPPHSSCTLSVTDDRDSYTTSWSLKFNDIGSVSFKPNTYKPSNFDPSLEPFVALWDKNELILTWCVRERTHTWFWELLPIGPLRWVSAAYGEIPVGAVQGGHESDGRPLFVARGANPHEHGSYLPGKAGSHLAHSDLGGCIVGSDRSECRLSTYEVLVGDPDTYAWVPFKPDDRDTTCTIFRGKRMSFVLVDAENYQKLYSVRCKVGDALICGKGVIVTDSMGQSNITFSITANGVQSTYDGNAYEAEVLCRL